jgi:hypothetical protein
MLDLHEGIAELFDDAAGLRVLYAESRWSAWRRDRWRRDWPNELWRRKLRRIADRKARKPVEPIEPLAFPISCIYCRRGCHSTQHAYSCRARFAGASPPP